MQRRRRTPPVRSRVLDPAAVVWHLDDAPFVVVEATAFALETLPHQPKQHFAAKVAERRRLVRVDGEGVGPHQRDVVLAGGADC